MMQRSWCGSCDYSVELVLSSVVYYSTAVSLSIAADILILSTGVGPLSLSSRERERERERSLLRHLISRLWSEISRARERETDRQ
jgi:hypothetical protein